MSGRAPARALPIVIVVVAAAWCARAAADPLACQARAAYQARPTPVDVSFQALTAGGNPPLSFFWDFGDGSTSTEQSPSHTYTDAGVYQATLTVTDAGAPAETCRDTAVVTPGVIVDPVCLISAEPRWSEDSSPIEFSAGPGFVFDPPPYSWTWTFGDGTTSTVQSPQHSYVVPGTYWAAVTLHTTSSDRECGTIRVTTLVPQVVAAGPTRGGAGLRLDPPRPNPFEAGTTLAFTLPRLGRVRLTIVDSGGRRVATLVDEVRFAGPHVAVWQGRAGTGHPVPTGLYFAVLEHEGRTQTVRMARLR